MNLEEVTFLALLFLFKILKEKDLANEKCKTTELQEIKSRLEKESAKLGEELRACKQEFEKVHWDKLSLLHVFGYLMRNMCLLSHVIWNGFAKMLIVNIGIKGKGTKAQILLSFLSNDVLIGVDPWAPGPSELHGLHNLS